MLRRVLFTCAVLLIFSSVLVLAQAQIPEIGGRIVFVSDRSGFQNLWILDVSSGDVYPLTNFTAESSPWGSLILAPKWSTDGKKVAFWTQNPRPDSPDPNGREIFIINNDPLNLDIRLITNNWPENPHWDPIDPNYIYYECCKNYSKIIHKININSLVDETIPNSTGRTTQAYVITRNGNEMLFSREPSCCWSPTIYTGYQDMSGNNERIIRPTDGNAEFVSSINEIDGWIVFVQATAYHAPYSLYKMDKDGNSVTELASGISNCNGYPIWTTGDNNGYIIFTTDYFGNDEVVLMKADGNSYPSGIIDLTNFSGSDVWPDWTPHGANSPPLAEAGPDQIIEGVGQVTSFSLEGSNSSDPERDALSYSWMDGSGAVVGTGPTISLDRTLGEYAFTLTVTDPEGLSSSDIVSITICDTTPPNLTAPPDRISDQSDPYGTAVNLGQATAVDLCDPDPSIENNAPHLYPLGITEITWIATDVSGNSATAKQTITIVLGAPTNQLSNLAKLIRYSVTAGAIASEIQPSLMAKVEAASAALARGNPSDAKVAMNELAALVKQVEAQTEKKITPDVAIKIIACTNRVITDLGG